MIDTESKFCPHCHESLTAGARGLPKVGESVDIYTAPGLSYRRKVLAHLEGGFLDDTGGSCPRKWLLAEENMIPGWRRVPAGGTSERVARVELELQLEKVGHERPLKNLQEARAEIDRLQRELRDVETLLKQARATSNIHQEESAECNRENARLVEELADVRREYQLAHDQADRLKACAEDYQRVNASLVEGLSYQQAENARLNVRVGELVGALP